MMGALAVIATLIAVGVGLNGYRNTPARVTRVDGNAPGGSNGPRTGDSDPMAPRLFDQSSTIRIHVAGAVRKPGVYSLPAWARVADAMKKAGGNTKDADLDAINLADTLKDAEQVRIPFKGRREAAADHAPTPSPPAVIPDLGGHRGGRYPFTAAVPPAETIYGASSSTNAPRARNSPPASEAPHGERHASTPAGHSKRVGGIDPPINLNRATRDELEGLPGIGAGTAEKILAYRQEYGGFQSPEDLMNVKGIGQKRFERLRPLITAP